MLDNLCNVLKERAATTGYFTKVGGLVMTIEKQDENEAGKMYTVKFPATADHNIEQCGTGVMVDMIPNSSFRGVMYFEADTITPTEKRFTFGQQYAADIRLVGWLNREQLGSSPETPINRIVIGDVLLALTQPYKVQTFGKLAVSVTRIIEGNQSIFSKYTYSVKDRQYLMPPFCYFAIDLRVTFVSRVNCAREPFDVQPKTQLC